MKKLLRLRPLCWFCYEQNPIGRKINLQICPTLEVKQMTLSMIDCGTCEFCLAASRFYLYKF